LDVEVQRKKQLKIMFRFLHLGGQWNTLFTQRRKQEYEEVLGTLNVKCQGKGRD
jgi:hypothetical protein